MEHKFFKVGDDWNIRCPITGGSFSTALWLSGKQSSQKCPCCDQRVEKHK